MLKTKSVVRSNHPQHVAKRAGLIYTHDSGPGWTRLRQGKSFRYRDHRGRALKPAQVARVKALVIPPAWEKVWIAPSPRGHIQVTGFDVRGRKQYRYHPRWTEAQNENKFSKMEVFAKKLPKIRRRIKKDLKLRGLPRNRVMALVVSILEQTLIRVGNDEYAKSNRSYGLTTIRNRHVEVRGRKVKFDFQGKSGKRHLVEVDDHTLAPLVRQCQELPGQELFAYRNGDGKVVDVTSQDVNSYLKEITGEDITAKDFRTWGGTVCAARFLRAYAKKHELPENPKDLKKVFTQTVKHTAKQLRNTPTICRKYYIHPCVQAAFESGVLSRISKAKGAKRAGLMAQILNFTV